MRCLCLSGVLVIALVSGAGATNFAKVSVDAAPATVIEAINNSGVAVYYPVADDGVGKVPTAAVQRSLVVVPGTHIVKVQFECACYNSLTNFRVAKWHLTVEAAPVQ